MTKNVDQSQAVLLAVGELLGREIALDDLLKILMDRIVLSMNADRGTLYLLDASRNELFSKAAHLPELNEIRLEVGQGIAGYVAQTGEVVNCDAANRECRFFSAIDRQTGYKSRSMLAVPMRDHRGRVMGVIQLLNKKGGLFSNTDVQMLLDLAAQAAMALEATSLYEELRRVEQDPVAPVAYRYNNIIGESFPMKKVYRATQKAASTLVTVLIRGESGTGKELIARAIQVNGARRDKPLIKVDCAALPAGLIENELFGHERGAYTGATHRAVGKFEAAQGGTVFLDEIGELPLAVQGKLLRVLQDRQFERVGGTDTIRADVRILAATNRNLEQLVQQGKFRADLYYRIRVLEVVLPPLRTRGEDDIRRLAQHFAALAARRHARDVPRFTDEAMDRLLSYPWPGNVRELEHCVESAVVLCDHGNVQEEDLPLPARSPVLPMQEVQTPLDSEPHADLEPFGESYAPNSTPAFAGSGSEPAITGLPSEPASTGSPSEPAQERDLSLDSAERRHILKVLRMTGDNRSRAARLLGIGRNTLLRKLKRRRTA